MILDIYKNCFSRVFIFSPSINIDYQPSTTEDEIVIVAETNSNKLFKISNYI